MKLFKNKVYLIGVALFALSAGCVSYKPPPEVIHADNYIAESDQAQRTLPPSYKVLSVNDAILIALANNPTYQQARLSMIKAWATYYSSLNAFTPNISVNYGIAQTGVYGKTGIGAPYYNQWTGGAVGTWNVFNGLQDTMFALSQYATAKSQENLNENARRLLINNVKQAYYSILQDKATIQIQTSNEMFWESQVAETQLKYSAGASSLSDLLNDKINRNGAQVLVIQAKAQYAVDRYVLAALLGLTSSDIPEQVTFPTVDVLNDEGYNLGVEFYLDMAINQRPDLQSQRELLKATRYSLYQSWGAFSPTVNLNWSYTFTSNNSSPYSPASASGASDPNFNAGWTNTYGATANWTIWDGGTGATSRIFNVRAAQATYDSAQESLLNTWISVVQNVRTSYTNLTSAIAQKKIQAATLSMSEERRDLVRDEYNAGNCDITTLNNAQNTLVQTQQDYVNALIGVAKNRANLDAACGIRN